MDIGVVFKFKLIIDFDSFSNIAHPLCYFFFLLCGEGKLVALLFPPVFFSFSTTNLLGPLLTAISTAIVSF